MVSSAYSNGFVINTNLASLLVQQNLANTTNEMATLMEHLSTNHKVNRASDDPAGLAVSLGYQKQISSIAVAKSNSQTGVSLLQTSEGDLKTIQSNLATMKNLIVQSQTGTTTDAQRASFNANYQQLMQEIDRVASTSNYSNIKLLDGSNSAAGSIMIQVDIGNSANDKIDISSALASVKTANLAGGIGSTSVSTVTGANAAQSLINNAYDQISRQLSLVGAFETRLNNNVTRLDTRSTNLQSADSLIRDTDTASDTAKLTKAQILQQTSAALLQQANSSSSLILTLIGATA